MDQILYVCSDFAKISNEKLVASGTKDHILDAKLDLVAVPYFTFFSFLQ